jgi:DNA-binding NarL/FixJ family response regulator
MVITGNAFHGAAMQALAAGADGFLLKHDHGDELLVGIRTVLAGDTYVTPSIKRDALSDPHADTTPSASSEFGLTAREQQIMRLIANGMTNPEVASALHISVLTARKHRQNLMNKLNLHNSAEITAYAIRSGLLEQPKRSPA